MKKKIIYTILLSGTSGFVSAQDIPADTTAEKLSQPSKTSYYIEPGSYGTKRETDPPSYIRELGKTGIKGAEKIDWLDVGLDYRARFEVRHNDLRREVITTDYPLLLRSRAYIGIKNIIDPFRAVIEFEDAHRVNGKFAPDNRDFNRAELIQAYAELHFKNALGKDDLGNSRALFIRFGRQAFEFTDRRLIGLNRWRNTTNNFLGLRTTLGQEKNDWQLDLLALRPINRLIDEFDKTDNNRDFWAVIGHWRKWSDALTIEPYYLGLKQRPAAANNNRERIIHSPGIRFYGWFNSNHINYDFTYTQQFGEDNGLDHNAYAVTAEVGYKFQQIKSKPRVSLFYGHVSGDKDPNDNVNNRFERFFGFARPWSSDDYVIPENIITPKLKLEFEPVKGVKFDGGYSFYWLASSTDRFNNLLAGSNNRDVTGNSGTFLGHGLDARVRFVPTKFIDANIGYTHYTMGEFVQNRQEAALNEHATSSDFFYIELSFNAFDMFKK
ncbi:hypothetical protein C900_04228 [Fulvivirga imtechensis AK7]|uniref:Alginate export domain-containing protein n=1 Tax=Fulvivirga imtechensis AK7 TaxID=1237149 RepID=L8JWG0_9BACT|nr:alginate export family protein [Fulvivirga imtechensis]ELR73376.1 hypothetical protein C900_04228 [Fulvivirga imtechensis AK7]